jgi:Flp pilus assembly protein TadD
LGYLLLEEKETLSEGIRLLRKAQRTNPSDPQALASLAAGYLHLGRPEEAAKLVRKAKRLAPQDAFVLEQVRRIQKRGRTFARAKAQRVLPE